MKKLTINETINKNKDIETSRQLLGGSGFDIVWYKPNRRKINIKSKCIKTTDPAGRSI